MYKIWLGWKGLVWTSSVPSMAVITPVSWTRATVEKMVGDFHVQAFTVRDTLAEAWDEFQGDERLMVDWVYWMTVDP